MSYRIGIDTLNLRPTERLAHIEFCSNERLRREVERAAEEPFEQAWQLDFMWNTPDGPVPWGERGRVTDMGHSEFLEGGADLRQPKASPFTDPTEVWAFDAVEEYGLDDMGELIAYYESLYQQGQQAYPGAVFPGGRYKTIFSGAIEAFGWEMLLMGGADEEAFEKVLDSFFRLSLHHVKAWAKTSIEAFICHDDMVWSSGPFMDPAFYRRVVFPRYAELWKVLRDAGKRVIYCSDGDWSEFVDDIVKAGAGGFIFEPMMDLAPIAERYGATHVLVGSMVDCRTLTFGAPADIQREIDATLPYARACPGFIFCVSNHIPSNVPVENGLFYFDYLSKNWYLNA